MGEITTTFLDAVAVLAIAGGITGGLWPHLGPWSLCIGGLVVIVASFLAASLRGDAE